MQANKENVPPSPTITRSQSARLSYPSPTSIDFSLDESFRGLPHLQRYFGSKLTNAKSSSTLSWNPSSSSPESIRSFNEKVANLTPPSPPRCHVCGTLCDKEKAEKYGLKSYLQRALDVLGHFGMAPGSFLLRLLSSSPKTCGKDSERLSNYISRFYSDGHISNLLNIWSKDKIGKKQILEWNYGDGFSVLSEELSKEGDSLCARFSFTSSNADPNELLGFDFDALNDDSTTLAPKFMSMLRAFAIPKNSRTVENGPKEQMTNIVGKSTVYACNT